jgi:spore germination protein YaaH
MTALLLLLAGCAGSPEADPLPRAVLPAPTEGPAARVYGYQPYWNVDLAEIPWDELSDLAMFAATAQADGSITNRSRWSATADAVTLAAPYGVRVHLCIEQFDPDVLSDLLGSATAANRLIDELEAEVEATGADGVNVDFEGVPASRRAQLTAFVEALAARVPEVVVATPAIDWSDAFDEASLSASADLFIMAYNYHWSTSPDAGPVDPLYGGPPWNDWGIEATIDDYLADGADPARTILGLPLYGYRWPTASDTVGADADGTGAVVLYEDAVDAFAAHGRRWDTVSHSPWAWDGSGQTWAPDAASVEERVAYALDRGLAGAGFWALQYDGHDPDLWGRVRDLTTVPGGPDDTDVPADTDTPDDTDAPAAGPTADAGLPLLAYPGDTVVLTGEGSRGEDLTYAWAQVAGPAVTLDDATRRKPRFVVPTVGTYTFELTVTDADGATASARTWVAVADPAIGRRYAGCGHVGGSFALVGALGLLARRRR